MAIDTEQKRATALLEDRLGPALFPDGSLATATDRANMLAAYFAATATYPSGFPTVSLEISTTDPFDTPSWQTVAQLKGGTITGGQPGLLGANRPGSTTAVVDDSDRHADPLNTSATLQPYLTPGRRCRIRATHNVLGGTVDLAHFYADDYPPAWLPPGYQETKFNGPDLLGFLAGFRAPLSVLDVEVLADNPTVYYGLSESFGAGEATDKSGNGYHGQYVGGRTPAGSLTGDGDGASTFVAGSAINIPLPAAIPDPYDTPSVDSGFTIECILRTDNKDPLNRYIFWQSDNRLHWQIVVYVDPSGFVVFGWLNDGGGITKTAQVDITDGAVHHLVCKLAWLHAGPTTSTQIWLDDLLYFNSYVGFPTAPRPLGMQVAGAYTFDGAQSGFLGTLDEFAIYRADIDGATRVSAHYQAVIAGWSGDPSGTRFGRILDEAGVPAADRDIDTGVSILGPARLGRNRVSDLASQLDRTEQGGLFAKPNGQLRHRDRHQFLTDTAALTSQWTFSDDPTDGTAYRCRLILQPSGRAQVHNIVDVGWTGGRVVTRDDASITANGEQELPIDTIAPSPTEATNLGEWITQHWADPQPVVLGIVLDPAADSRLWLPALTAKDGDRATISLKPQNTGARSTFDVVIVGAADHDFGEGINKWTTVLHCTIAEPTPVPYWVLGTSHLGTGTKLAY